MFDLIEIVVINNCVVLMAICLLIVWCLCYNTFKKKKKDVQHRSCIYILNFYLRICLELFLEGLKMILKI